MRRRFGGEWFRDGLLIAGALAFGWWAHGGRAVEAASGSTGDLQFQMQSTELPSNALLIYSANRRTIYVYRGPTGGNSHLQCTYKFLVSNDGETVDRQPCDMGSLIR